VYKLHPGEGCSCHCRGSMPIQHLQKILCHSGTRVDLYSTSHIPRQDSIDERTNFVTADQVGVPEQYCIRRQMAPNLTPQWILQSQQICQVVPNLWLEFPWDVWHWHRRQSKHIRPFVTTPNPVACSAT